MPSVHHEALLQLFRNRPRLAPELLRDALHQVLPEFSEARIESAELTDIQPAEYRADLVVLLLEDHAVLGIVIEVQLGRDDSKSYAWPAYVVNLRARIKCPVCLLVVATDEPVARWAATPIELGGGQCFTPYVLSPLAVPLITDLAVARADPELAVFSAMAHGRRVEVQTSIEIAAAAIAATSGLDADRAALYVDLVLSSITEAARRTLQAMKPENYEFQSDFARRYFSLGKAEGLERGKAEGLERGKAEGLERGKAEGLERGKAELLIKLAILKFGSVPDLTQSKIRAATAAELERMAEHVLSADTLDEMLRPF
jgi:hypothetical protein